MKLTKYVILMVVVCMVGMGFAACQNPAGQGTVDTTGSVDVVTSPDDNTEEDSGVIKLAFNGMSCTASKADACTANGNVFTITKAGTYELSGNLSDGQIRVQVPKTTEKTNEVVLILNGFSAYSSTTAPMYVVSADEVTIELAAGTTNRLEDADTYQLGAATKPSACLYSSDDLVIRGNGTLLVTGHFKNGIACSNDLRIKNGTITVKAVNNILKGGDSVTISGDSRVTLSGGEDGIKTDNEDKTGKGFIYILESAKVSITCSDDALQATQMITVESPASVTGTAGDSALNCDGQINCAEGTVNIVEGGGAN